MARFSKTEMKKLCDYVGCDSNGKADEMKFNVLLKIHQEGNKAFAALIKNDLKQYEEAEKDDDSGDENDDDDEEGAFAALIKNDLKQYEADEEESEEESEDQKDDDDDDSGEEKAEKKEFNMNYIGVQCKKSESVPDMMDCVGKVLISSWKSFV